MTPVFYNETSHNNRYQVKTTELLEGKGILNLGGSVIVDHQNQLFKDNKTYWVSKSALGNIKNNYNTIRTCF